MKKYRNKTLASRARDLSLISCRADQGLRRRGRQLAALGAQMLLPSLVSADTFRWVGGAEGYFTELSNWTVENETATRAPGAGDRVEFRDKVDLLSETVALSEGTLKVGRPGMALIIR